MDRTRLLVAAGAGVTVLIATLLVLSRGGAGMRFDVRAPTPDPDAVAYSPRELPPSVFTVPVEVRVSRLIAVLEDALPRRYGDMADRFDIPDRDDLDAAFELERGPISATFVDSTAALTTRISYRARAWYDPPVLPEVSASCGTGDDGVMPRLDVTLVTPLALDQNWRLRSRIRAGTIAPPTDEDRDRCRVTVLNFDMTGRVVNAVRDVVGEYGPRADSALAELDLRPDFEAWWSILATPIRLSDGVWLVMNPMDVSRGRIVGSGSSVRTSLTLRARPRVVVSSSEPETDAPRLPPLGQIDAADGLRILAEAEATYGEVVGLLRSEIVGRPVQAGENTLEVRDVSIQGVGDGRLAVRIVVAGDAEGVLYLVGTPRYDPLADQITVPDLDFDVASREAFVESAAWIARAGLVERFRDRARWPAAPAADWARRQVETGFNSRLSSDVRLEGSVDTVTVRSVYAGPDALLVRAEVRGRATLVVEGG